MNALEKFIIENRLDPNETMSRLQGEASPCVISDNCIRPEDVCASDAGKAVKWLKSEKGELI